MESHQFVIPISCISWTQKLNHRVALMSGRMRLRGDIRIAMRLDKVFGLAGESASRRQLGEASLRLGRPAPLRTHKVRSWHDPAHVLVGIFVGRQPKPFWGISDPIRRSRSGRWSLHSRWQNW